VAHAAAEEGKKRLQEIAAKDLAVISPITKSRTNGSSAGGGAA
jgi:hypothetical protein